MKSAFCGDFGPKSEMEHPLFQAPNPPSCMVTISSVSILFCLFVFRPATPDLEAACHLSSKQLEELMEDGGDCPVSNGDPMLSSPHLSPFCGSHQHHAAISSPSAASSAYSDAGGPALSPADSMDLAA